MEKQKRLSTFINDSVKDSIFSKMEGKELSNMLRDPSISIWHIHHVRADAALLLRSRTDLNGLVMNWFLPLIKLLDKAIDQKTTKQTQVLFSPGKSIRRKVVELIEQSQRSVLACIYTFSEPIIADALI